MDLVAGVGRVVALMSHASRTGESTALRECTLPLTGAGVVNRIITDLGGLDVVEGGLRIVECAPEAGSDEIAAATEAAIF